MDNGAPWGSDWQHPYTRLTTELMRLGIAVSHGRPYHPQTQGKLERFHRSLHEEVLHETPFADHDDAQRAFDRWRCVYNQERPHQALDWCVPNDRYTARRRLLPQALALPRYPAHMVVRQVSADGHITFQSGRFRVGRAFAGYPVGLLRRTGEPHIWDAYFAEHLVYSLQSGSRQLRLPGTAKGTKGQSSPDADG